MIDRLSMSSLERSSLSASWGAFVAIFLAVGMVLVGCDSVGGGGDEDTTPPEVPTSLAVDSESGAVLLEWSAPQDDDLAGYNVYRAAGTSIDVGSDTPLNEDGLVSSPSFTDESPENGTTYRYRVTAIDDSDNESDPSDSVQVTAFADPPTRPSE